MGGGGGVGGGGGGGVVGSEGVYDVTRTVFQGKYLSLLPKTSVKK